MRKALLAAAVVALSLSMTSGAFAFTKVAERFDGGASPYGLSGDCTLLDYNLCSSWIWTFNDAQGAIWGHVFDPNDCASACINGGAVSSVVLYSRCNVVPGSVNSIRIDAVDANNCPTALLCETGPLSLTHCVAGDRWTTIALDPNDCHLGGNPFAVSIEFGVAGDITYATDNGIANLFCANGVTGTFPGCFSTVPTCGGYVAPTVQKSFIFVTDFNGDTILDDLCAMYGQPYGLAFPYVSGYGYMVNNLIMAVGLDCSSPTATENSTWGHVKALYE
jgi:hypothetical protein